MDRPQDTGVNVMPHYRPSEIFTACLALLPPVTKGQVLEYTRGPAIGRVRSLIAGAMHHMTTMSYPEIGCAMGRNWHSTAYDQVGRFHELDPLAQADWLVDVRQWIGRDRAENGVPVGIWDDRYEHRRDRISRLPIVQQETARRFEAMKKQYEFENSARPLGQR